MRFFIIGNYCSLQFTLFQEPITAHTIFKFSTDLFRLLVLNLLFKCSLGYIIEWVSRISNHGFL